MGKSHNIYDKNRLYDLVHWQTSIYIRRSFRKRVVCGLSNIPNDGALIFAPNHCNTLMDPLVILESTKKKIVFVARADIFRAKTAAKILTFLRIMPINRKRDGIRTVLQTDETIKKSIDVLNNGAPFCILPEGTHRTMHSLMKIGKGISRIACGAVETCKEKVYIIPTGLEYGDYFRYRSTLAIHYGEPIDVTQLISEMEGESQLEIHNRIRQIVGDRIKENIVYLPDDEDYEAMWELTKIWSSRIPELNVLERFNANREAASRLMKLREENPQRASELFRRAELYKKKRLESKISMHVSGVDNILFETIVRTLILTVFAPIALCYAAVSFPVLLGAELLCVKGNDTAFNNSLRCCVMDFIWTFFLIVWAVVLFVNIKPLLALAALILILPAPFICYDFVEMARRTLSCWRSLFHKELREENASLFDEVAKL